MKQQILDQVAKEIQLNGLRFTLDDIAKRMHISKKTIYKQFASKTAIIEAIVMEGIEETDQKTKAIFADEQLSIVHKIRQLMLVMPTYYQIYNRPVLNDMQQLYPQQWQKAQEALSKNWRELEFFIKQAIENKELITNCDVSIMIRMLKDAFYLSLEQQFFYENHVTVNEALTQIVDIFLYGILPRSE